MSCDETTTPTRADLQAVVVAAWVFADAAVELPPGHDTRVAAQERLVDAVKRTGWSQRRGGWVDSNIYTAHQAQSAFRRAVDQ